MIDETAIQLRLDPELNPGASGWKPRALPLSYAPTLFNFEHRKSFMKILNNKGSRIDPCGTPLMLYTHSEYVSPILNFCCHFMVYNFIRSNALLSNPYADNFASRSPSGIQSKALDR